jgi:integrase
MAKKRGNGEGSISKRKDGRWQGAVTIGRKPDGSLNRKTFYGKTKKEVTEKLLKAQHDLMQGTYTDSGNLKVADWMNTWLVQYKKGEIKPKTYDDYEYLIEQHIIPEIGAILLKNLKTNDLQSLYNRKSESGLSPRTVRYIHSVLHNALNQAVRGEIITRNVSDATSLPRREKKEMRVLSLEEQEKLIHVLQNDEHGFPFLFALATGLRKGELLGLRWKDVNFDENLINVRRNLSYIKNRDPEGTTKYKLITQEPKTERGQRSIPMPESIVVMLGYHQQQQKKNKELYAEKYIDNDLVFPSQLGTAMDPSNFSKRFYALVKKSGIEMANVHATRHSYATRLLEANVHPKIVQDLLGHSSISITLNTYSHVMPELKQEASEKLNGLFDTKKSPTPNKE